MILRVRDAIATALVLAASIGTASAQDYSRPDYGMMPPPGEAGVPGSADVPNPVRSGGNGSQQQLPNDPNAPDPYAPPSMPSFAPLIPIPSRQQPMGHPVQTDDYAPMSTVIPTTHKKTATTTKKKPHPTTSAKAVTKVKEPKTTAEEPLETDEAAPKMTEEAELTTSSLSTKTFYTTASQLPTSTSTIYVQPTKALTGKNGLVQPSSSPSITTSASKSGATVRTDDPNKTKSEAAGPSGRLNASLAVLAGVVVGFFVMF